MVRLRVLPFIDRRKADFKIVYGTWECIRLELTPLGEHNKRMSPISCVLHDLFLGDCIDKLEYDCRCKGKDAWIAAAMHFMSHS